MTTFFIYNQLETNFLSERDPKMGSLIQKFGQIERKTLPDLFEALINSIVAQQISSKAAQTVYARLVDKCGIITPINLNKLTDIDIQTCGMSMRKAINIKKATQAVLSGKLEIEKLNELKDTEVISILSELDGIGIWTAEMLMIFSMQRKDILSYSDLAIRRAICILHNVEKISKLQFEHFKTLYSPYGSVASLYLWKLAGETPTIKKVEK